MADPSRSMPAWSGRTGTLLRVSLNVPGASQLGQTASLCLANSGHYFPAASGGWDSTGALYATPLRDKDVLFAYESAWQGSPGAQYDLAGAVTGAIPARPDYSARAARLAKVIMQVRSGTSLSSSGNFAIEPVFGGDCSPSSGASAAAGSEFTDYRTAGRWTTDLQFTESNWSLTRKYRSDHSYTDTFNGAVRGPPDEFPSINGDYFQYTPGDLFNDPSIAGSECCAKATVTQLGKDGPRPLVVLNRLSVAAQGSVRVAQVVQRLGLPRRNPTLRNDARAWR